MATRPITGLSAVREQAYQERVMLSIARASEVAIRKEMNRAYRAIALGDDSDLVEHELRMNNLLTRIYSTAFDRLGRRLWNASKKSANGYELKKEVPLKVPLTPQFDLARTIWIKSVAAEKVTQITGTTKAQAEKLIQDALAESIELGLGEKETAKLIEKAIRNKGGELSRLRGRIISRTETHSASGASQQMAAKASGLPMVKEWVTSIVEGRTRDDHISVNGQKVGIDEPFVVGGEYLMYPGDPNGSAAQIINCLCVAVYGLG